ncbi:Cation proton exchanger [Dorcoceras hygrometricum]|uniref:Cation proton exchanger n=1 Tax=Dorcoceras hygrometricum TaxID=472368 RepID=A0A2Z7CXR6_9LAMI|nr:Cation proton exchanger [Dorcoceras hygrometricum]
MFLEMKLTPPVSCCGETSLRVQLWRVMHLIKKEGRYPNWNSKGTPMLVRFEDIYGGTVRGRPSWYNRSLPDCRTVQEQIKCSVQVWCSSANPRCFSESLDEFKVTPHYWSRGRICMQGKNSGADQHGEQLKNRICSDIGSRLETSWFNQLDKKNKSR